MKYRLKILEETVDVDVSHLDSEHNVQFIIEGKEYHVRYQTIANRYFHLVMDGKSIEVFVARGDQGKHIFVNGCTFLVQDADQLLLRRARLRGSEETPGEVTPPMPSVVLRIMVKEGERVKRGQGLVVVSAMKMQTTLVAHSDGTVKKINTSIDAKVAPGDILVEIEEEVVENE
jgi:3-methylcrotonyl-CoA carboxylase alpha subunit